MTTEEAANIVSRHEPLVVVCTYNILFTNDIVMGLIIESTEMTKKTPIYRQKTKQLILALEKGRKDYEKIINEIIGDKDEFFADANECFSFDVMPHLDTLYYSIKNEFDKARVPYSSVISKLEQARTMAGFSCAQYDKRMEELKKTDVQLGRFALQYLRISNISRVLDEIMRSIHVECTVQLDNTPAAKALDIVSMRLANIDSIAKAIVV